MRTFPLFLLAIACSTTETPAPIVKVDVHVPEQDAPTIVVQVLDEDGDTETDGSETTPEYNGQRAVLEGWMSSNDVLYSQPGDTVDMGRWTFTTTSFDGLEHVANLQPTGFSFTVESDGDGRFGLPTDQVLAGDIIHFCWLVQAWPDGQIETLGSSDIGGPELNSMAGAYGDYPVGDQLEIGLWCELYDNAPLGTKIAARMEYNIISDADVYDASVAREDNSGALPQYFVQVGPDSCGNYDLEEIYHNRTGITCSRPSFEMDTTATFYQAGMNGVPIRGSFGIRDGLGDGSMIEEMYVSIDNLPEGYLFPGTNVDLYFDGQLSVSSSCIPVSDGFGNNEIVCNVPNVDETLLTANGPLPFEARLNLLPSVPVGHELGVTVYYKWSDLATGDGTSNSGGWSVLDGDYQTITSF